MAQHSITFTHEEGQSQPVLRLRSGDLGWRSIDGEVIAIDVASSRYLGANPSGAVLWEKLAEGASLDELADALASLFGITESRARHDVAAFLQSLDERGLLEHVSPGG